MLPVIRLDEMGGAQRFPFGPPSPLTLRDQLARLQGGSPRPAAIGPTIEQTAGIVLGAGLNGLGQANDLAPGLLMALGLGAAVYGAATGQAFMMSVGQGALAPLVAEWARQNFGRGATAQAPADGNVVSMPKATTG